MPRVFISFATEDRKFVAGTLVPVLKKAKVSAFEMEQIELAEDFQVRIRKELARADWIVIVVSRHSVDSLWVKAEVRESISDKPERVIHLLLDDSDPGDIDIRLPGGGGVAWHADPAQARARLVAVLKGKPPPPASKKAAARKGGKGKRWFLLLLLLVAAAAGTYVWKPALFEDLLPRDAASLPASMPRPPADLQGDDRDSWHARQLTADFEEGALSDVQVADGGVTFAYGGTTRNLAMDFLDVLGGSVPDLGRHMRWSMKSNNVSGSALILSTAPDSPEPTYTVSQVLQTAYENLQVRKAFEEALRVKGVELPHRPTASGHRKGRVILSLVWKAEDGGVPEAMGALLDQVREALGSELVTPARDSWSLRWKLEGTDRGELYKRLARIR